MISAISPSRVLAGFLVFFFFAGADDLRFIFLLLVGEKPVPIPVLGRLLVRVIVQWVVLGCIRKNGEGVDLMGFLTHTHTHTFFSFFFQSRHNWAYHLNRRSHNQIPTHHRRDPHRWPGPCAKHAEEEDLRPFSIKTRSQTERLTEDNGLQLGRPDLGRSPLYRYHTSNHLIDHDDDAGGHQGRIHSSEICMKRIEMNRKFFPGSSEAGDQILNEVWILVSRRRWFMGQASEKANKKWLPSSMEEGSRPRVDALAFMSDSISSAAVGRYSLINGK